MPKYLNGKREKNILGVLIDTIKSIFWLGYNCCGHSLKNDNYVFKLFVEVGLVMMTLASVCTPSMDNTILTH